MIYYNETVLCTTLVSDVGTRKYDMIFSILSINNFANFQFCQFTIINFVNFQFWQFSSKIFESHNKNNISIVLFSD